MEEFGKNNQRKLVTKHDRKIDRNIARWRMKQRGITQINKDKNGNGGYFANNWRDYVH